MFPSFIPSRIALKTLIFKIYRGNKKRIADVLHNIFVNFVWFGFKRKKIKCDKEIHIEKEIREAKLKNYVQKYNSIIYQNFIKIE